MRLNRQWFIYLQPVRYLRIIFCGLIGIGCFISLLYALTPKQVYGETSQEGEERLAYESRRAAQDRSLTHKTMQVEAVADSTNTAETIPIYTESLDTDWDKWGTAQYRLVWSDPTSSGKAISVTADSYEFLQIYPAYQISTHKCLRFRSYGNSGDVNIRVVGNGDHEAEPITFTAQAGQWNQHSLSISSIINANPSIQDIRFINRTLTSTSIPTVEFFLDDIELTDDEGGACTLSAPLKLPVFLDTNLEEDWDKWGTATFHVGDPGPKSDPRNSIKVTANNQYQFIRLFPAPLTDNHLQNYSTQYQCLRFKAKANNAGQRVRVITNWKTRHGATIDLLPNESNQYEWNQYEIDFKDLGYPISIQNIRFTNVSGATATFYLDDIELSSSCGETLDFPFPDCSADYLTDTAGSNTMRCQYNDPITDRKVFRMTTDGSETCTNFIGDQSSESTSWSPDSRYVTYAKECDVSAYKKTGIYVMNLATGNENFVAATTGKDGYPIFSADGKEVYYVYKIDDTEYRVRAVDIIAKDPIIREVIAINYNEPISGIEFTGIEKITRNSNGTYLAIHPTLNDTNTQPNKKFGKTVIFSPATGSILTGWDGDLNTGLLEEQDSSVWHPTNPNLIFTRRSDSGSAIYDLTSTDIIVVTLVPFAPGHTAWHPDGDLLLRADEEVWNRQTKTVQTPYPLAGSIDGNAPHPFFNPMDVVTDPMDPMDPMDARIVYDTDFDSTISDGSEHGPFLYVMPINYLLGNKAPTTLAQVHAQPYRYVTHLGEIVDAHDEVDGTISYLTHPHPQFSPNAEHLLWLSNTRIESFASGSPCGYNPVPLPWGKNNPKKDQSDLYIAAFDNNHFAPGEDVIALEAECGILTPEAKFIDDTSAQNGYYAMVENHTDTTRGAVIFQFIARHTAAYTIEARIRIADTADIANLFAIRLDRKTPESKFKIVEESTPTYSNTDFAWVPIVSSLDLTPGMYKLWFQEENIGSGTPQIDAIRISSSPAVMASNAARNSTPLEVNQQLYLPWITR